MNNANLKNYSVKVVDDFSAAVGNSRREWAGFSAHREF